MAPLDPSNSKRKRGRPPNASRQDADASQELADDGARPKKRGRPAREAVDNDAERGAGEAPVPRRKRGRPSLSNNEKQSAEQAEGHGPARRRGRPAHHGVPGNAKTKGGGGPRREGRGRPPKEKDATARRPPEAEAEAGKRKRRADKEQGDEDEDEGAPPSPPPKPYTHIAPRVHRIRRSAVESRWSPLGEAPVSCISSTLRLAHRPILQRLSNTQQRRQHTSSALALVAQRITRRITRGLPFPPAAMAAGKGEDARAAELSLESVLDAKHELERQLDPALHAVELLGREKGRLERELERDYEVLRNLEGSARAQAREYRGLLKKAHVLTPGAPSNTPSDLSASLPGLFDNIKEDEERVRHLALQLGNHVDSMASNLAQTEGITSQISRGRAALQNVLFRYLDQEQYERVVLG